MQHSIGGREGCWLLQCFYFVSLCPESPEWVSVSTGSVQMWFQSLRNQSEREPSHSTKHPYFKPIGSSAVLELHELTHPEWVSVFCLPSDWFGANVISKLEKSKREGNDSISQTFSNPTSQWSLRLKFKHRGNMCVFGSKYHFLIIASLIYITLFIIIIIMSVNFLHENTCGEQQYTDS